MNGQRKVTEEGCMKKEEIVQELKKLGWWYLQEGGSHETWTNGKRKVSIPRHSEIKKGTCLGILKRAKEQ